MTKFNVAQKKLPKFEDHLNGRGTRIFSLEEEDNIPYSIHVLNKLWANGAVRNVVWASRSVWFDNWPFELFHFLISYLKV